MTPISADAVREASLRAAKREELIRTREALELHYGEILARESIKNPLVWGRYATKTKDEQDLTGNPYKGFPEWEFFDYLLPILRTEPVIFIKKSRTVMLSWVVSLYCVHEMLTKPATGVVFQSRDHDRAVHDVDCCKELYANSIPQLKDRWPLTGPLQKQSFDRFELANGSWCLGISGDPKKINSEHPSIVVLDEAALMERGADSYASALATRSRTIIALSSAEPGWFEEYVEGARPENWPEYSLEAVAAYLRTKKTLFPAEFTPSMAPERAFTHDPQTWSPSRSKPSFDSPSAQMAATKDYVPELGRRVTTYSFNESKAAWKQSPNVKTPIGGVQFSRTKAGVAVVHVHYSARADMRDARAVEKLRWKYPSLSYWEKEMEMKARALSGALVYPDFDSAIHMISPDRIPKKGCIYMAIDPHPRTPTGCVWCLVDRWHDVYVFRELWPSKVYGMETRMRDDEEENSFVVREYAETIAVLEGNEIEWVHAEESNEYGIYRRKKGGEHVITRYMDQAGKAFNTRGEGEKAESYWEKYDRMGIACFDPDKRHVAGEDAVRDLLKPRKHEIYGTWPRLHISTECPELELEIKRHKYRSTQKLNDEKELKQSAAESRRHLVDCLRYLATGDIAYVRSLESERFDLKSRMK